MDEDEEEQEKKLEIPKYTLLYEDDEVTLKIPTEEGEEREEEQKDEQEEKEKESEEENSENQKPKPMDKIIKILAEIFEQTPNLTDKELCIAFKKKLDEDPELNNPSISAPDIEENGVWQVIIGKQFAASVTFDAKYIYYFQLEESKKYFLVFRS